MEPLELLKQSRTFQGAIEALGRDGRCVIVGRTQSFFAFLLAGVRQAAGQPVCVVLPDERKAEQFYQDAHNFLPAEQMQFLPGRDLALAHEEGISEESVERIRILLSLAKNEGPAFTVTYFPAILRLIPSRRALRESEVVLAPGTTLRRDTFIKTLLRFGYDETDVVEVPGEFARRGGIVDIYPPGAEFPVRIELAGDTVNSLRRFEVSSQSSFEKTGTVSFHPLSEEHIQGDVDTAVSDLFSGGLSFLVEPDAFDEEKFVGELSGEHRAAHLSAGAVREIKEKTHVLEEYMSQKARTGTLVNFQTFPVSDRFRVGEIFVWNQSTDETLILYSSNLSQEHRLREILLSHKVPADRISFRPGTLSTGFAFPEGRTAFVSNDEIFARYQTRHVPLRKSDRVPLGGWEELKEGDYVVHYNEGIGKFTGMTMLKVDGEDQEFILLEYDGGDKLYVPLHQIQFLHKYVGARNPVLSKLGSKTWLRVKEQVKNSIRDMAADLYKLYLERKKAERTAFLPDDDLQREFEAGFIYQETPDQMKAIKEVKRDMVSPKIMDRLICGDSGYGKTEVAMRAAFKAVVSGTQVAVLVPTTVLALQHYFTFKERFADFPVRVEMLSRFVPPRQQLEILQAMREGRVDIVIGTHRLISRDIKFKKLGLLVIDEEQRFGVSHKEKMKTVFRTVDVITLSATPIPRTLYLSLSGLRDISLIETPPLGRLSVITHVGKYDDNLVREAVVRELERKGQVFYLHNFVFDIEQVRARLKKLAPDARIEVAHGQMDGPALEEIMERFSSGEIDVLIATTIVENGLDIPRANTLIADSAHRLGLADMYQLRGRVGRYKWRAYAYFLVPRHIALTEESRTRLQALQELNKPGSGFRVALRDLEIRGMGNILGQQQHGFIEQVGFHLYCRFWKELSGQLHVEEPAGAEGPAEPAGDELVESAEPKEVSFAVTVPADYVAVPALRFWIYRRIAETPKEKMPALIAEMEDRFGPVPKELARRLTGR